MTATPSSAVLQGGRGLEIQIRQSPAIMMSGQGPAYASNIQSLQGFARCNLQAKPEREERNAEMAGTRPPARHGVWERRVGAGLS